MRYVLIMLIVCAGRLSAQSCASPDGQTAYCNDALNAAYVIQPALAIAASGGNPVAGASSTLGMRIGRIPRVSATLRATGVTTRIPEVAPAHSSNTNREFFRSINLDVSVGLLKGWSLLPTIGGFASIDVIGSVGKMIVPDALLDNSPASRAAGVRVGILRESFTTPGLSLTALYRSIDDVRHGRSANEATYALSDMRDVSLRAVLGKRVFVLGANLGVGLDRMTSRASASSPNSTGLVSAGFPSITHTYPTGFASVNWTTLIVNVVLEGGYQRSKDVFPADVTTVERNDQNNYYGTVAVRVVF